MIKKLLGTLMIFLSLYSFCQAKEGIKTDYDQKFKFHIYKIDTEILGKKIKPFVVEEGLKSANEVFKENDFELVLNGSFFDPVSTKSVSYITIDNKCVTSPFDTLSLIENLAAQKRLENVLNRVELRILEHELFGKLKFDIDYHFAPVEKGYKIKHSLQGGPMLYPDMDLAKEGFVTYAEDGMPQTQAASVLKRRARTMLALRDNDLYIILFTNFAPVTMGEAQGYLKKYKFKKIMALDGGPSTSLNYKDTEIFSSTGKQRKLKSFLVIEK